MIIDKLILDNGQNARPAHGAGFGFNKQESLKLVSRALDMKTEEGFKINQFRDTFVNFVNENKSVKSVKSVVEK